MNESHPPAAASEAALHPPSPGSGVAGDAHDHDHAHDVSKHVKKYLLVGGLLLAFTGLTVFLSYMDFGSHKANMAIGMVVAAFKAGLVAAIFMHLSAEKKLIYRILIFTVFFVAALFWLTYLAWYDPITR